jgi:tyrosine-protein kinase Etk/Wzc
MNPQPPNQYDAYEEVDFRDENTLGKILGTLIDGRWIIIPLVVLFAMGGFFYGMFATPIYKADSLLQVEKKASVVSGLADMTTGMLDQTPSSSTEIDILKSRMVIGKAVDELALDVFATPHYFPKIGRGLVRLLGPSQSGMLVSLFSSYAWGGEKIHVGRLEVPNRLLGTTFTLVAGEHQDYQLFNGDKKVLSGKVGELAEGSGISLLVTDLVSRPGVEFFVTRIPRISAVRALQSNLVVDETDFHSGILNLSLSGSNKEQIRKILDSVSKNYLFQNVQRMSAEAEKGLAFLNSQLPEVKAKLDASEQALSDYRLKNRSVDLSLETSSLLQQVVNIDAQLNQLDFKKADLLRRFTKDHPSYIALIKQGDILLQQKQALQKQIDTLPQTQQEILRFTRDAQVNQSIYLQLINKANELSIVKAGTVGNVRILDKAEPLPYPVKPRKGRILIISTILGFMLGVGVVFLRAALHRGVKSTDDIEAIGLPVYATIPFSELQNKLTRWMGERKISDVVKGKGKGKGKGKDKSDESSLLAVRSNDDLSIEAIRSLRTSMHFAMMESTGNALMITGPSQEIGKSFVAVNLAAVYAQMGQKVLLIDADMRKGHMHKMLGVEQGNGLSEYLSHQVKDVVKATEVEGLDFISCGKAPPNPSELLMLKEFGELIEWAKGEYDLVIIDTPPVLAVTDATVVGHYAGISMLVAWFDETPVKEIEASVRRCEQNGIHIKGCILNGIVKKAGYHTYGEYGYYHYSYGKKAS